MDLRTEQMFMCMLSVPCSLNWQNVWSSVAGIPGAAVVIDTEFANESTIQTTKLELRRHLNYRKEKPSFGIRLNTTDLDKHLDFAYRAKEQEGFLILSQGRDRSKAVQRINQLLEEDIKILIEVSSAEEYKEVVDTYKNVDIVLKGQENGGFCGTNGGFILAQQILEQKKRRIYVRGGIGSAIARGCKNLGADGILLSDEILLMPEVGLGGPIHKYLASLNGQEAKLYGETGDYPVRLVTRRGSSSQKKLQEAAIKYESKSSSSNEDSDEWISVIREETQWDTEMEKAWPIGQGIGLAKHLVNTYKGTRTLVKKVLRDTQKSRLKIEDIRTMKAGSDLAESHGTKYPIVQGPMTRVSDTAEFAEAIAVEGGLPMVALAMMKAEQAEDLLIKTSILMKHMPWGVGILGFAPQKVRDGQIAAIKKVKPEFAIIAGGRPDQAKAFEETGIKTYLHVPSPALLKLFLSQGARRFIFEGRECGGHVGPLGSFVLWQSMIDVLLVEARVGKFNDIHILFAGGIHNGTSAVFIESIGEELAQAGIKIGVLMGTAYLFTEEAVISGAILPEYQEQAISCIKTINLETGIGHASRCAVTPFAKEFNAEKFRLIEEGSSQEEIKDYLENLSLGRLRLASKGTERNKSGQIVEQTVEAITNKGMVMIGEVAQLRNRTTTIAKLHREICSYEDWPIVHENENIRTGDIAVIGMSTIVPGSHEVNKFWDNILEKRDFVTEVPRDRWDWQIYFSEDTSDTEKIYSKWGGFIDDVLFDPIEYGIPPIALKSIEPLQLLSLEAVKKALIDCGYWEKQFDRENTSVILGAGGGLGDLGQQYATRSEIPRFIQQVDREVWDRLPKWTEESFPGILLNVIAGRIANKLNFGGINYTVDAACASSLAAIEQAIKELQLGTSSVVITGGVDTIQTPFAYYCFSRSQALSPTGRCRSFDTQADGIAISEGIAILVLKRLEDAERDGDKIYCIIKGAAGSSDGKGLGMTAPKTEGQVKALERAYKKAGFSPSEIGLYEAHGTGTVVGDRTELETLISILKKSEAKPKSCAMGSVKTMIGHTKSTAGAVGLIKSAMALYHKVLPPHINVEKPIGGLQEKESPVYLLKESKPWIPGEKKRLKAGVSAFGFGGTNFHIVVEEPSEIHRESVGSKYWPAELMLMSAASKSELTEKINKLLAEINSRKGESLRDLTYRCNLEIKYEDKQSIRLAIIAQRTKDLAKKLEQAKNQLSKDSVDDLQGIYVSDVKESTNRGVALLFPGQGSQYVNMYREACIYIRDIRQQVGDISISSGKGPELRLLDIIYPPSAYNREELEEQYQTINKTEIAQPAIGLISLGIASFIERLGIKPCHVAGHSFGELTALCYAGAISVDDFENIARKRGRFMQESCESFSGGMAAILGKREITMELINSVPDIQIANINSPTQVVVSGSEESISKLCNSQYFKGNTIKRLNVNGAFHTDFMREASAKLRDEVHNIILESPTIEVSSNTTGKNLGSDEDLKLVISEAMVQPVLFEEQVLNMYANGIRVFLEVGPKKILKGLIDGILHGNDFKAISFDSDGGSLAGVLEGLGQAYVSGISVNPSLLYEDRVADLNLNTKEIIKERTSSWLVNGGGVRKTKDNLKMTGILPALKYEDKIQNVEAEKKRLYQIQNEQTLRKPDQSKILTSIKREPSQTNEKNYRSQFGQKKTFTSATKPMNNSLLDAYYSYQETMRIFLKSQEQVLSAFMETNPAVSSREMTDGNVKNEQPYQQPMIVHQDRIVSGGVDRMKGTHKSIEVMKENSFTVANESETYPNIGWDNATMPLKELEELDSTRPSEDVSFDLDSVLKKIVSDRTGYPEDMINMDADLEAELGIDSIKRVEIIGALQRELPKAHSSEVEKNMELLTRIKTLAEISRHLKSSKKVFTSSGAENRSISDISSDELASTSESIDIGGVLIDIICEKTGYPSDMLNMKQDLEAELGIDSIKRVEILGAIREHLPISAQEQMSTKMDQLTKCKDLESLERELRKLINAKSNGLEEDSRLGK